MDKTIEKKLGTFDNPVEIKRFEDLLKTEDSIWVIFPDGRIELKVATGEEPGVVTDKSDYDAFTYRELDNYVQEKFYSSDNGLNHVKLTEHFRGTEEYHKIAIQIKKHKQNGD